MKISSVLKLQIFFLKTFYRSLTLLLLLIYCSYDQPPSYERKPVRHRAWYPQSPPLAPDALLPNSIVLDALRPTFSKDDDSPRRWRPKQLRSDQLVVQDREPLDSDISDDDFDDESSGPLSRALAAERAESEPESPRSSVSSAPRRKLSLSKLSNFRALSVRTPSVSSSPGSPQPPLLPVSTSTQPIASPRTSMPAPSPRRRSSPPPLPRFITQFRGDSWFGTYFPNAVPSTFDVMRKPPVNEEIQQVKLEKFVSYLCGPLGGENLGPGLIHVAPPENAAQIARALRSLSEDRGATFNEEVTGKLVEKLRSNVRIYICLFKREKRTERTQKRC